MKLQPVASAVGSRIDIIVTKPNGDQVVMAFEARSSDSLIEFEISNEMTDVRDWTGSSFVSQFPTGRHGFKLTGEALHVGEPAMQPAVGS